MEKILNNSLHDYIDMQKMQKNDIIFIRCKEDVKRKFKVFIADRGFKDMNSALDFLLNEANRLNLRPRQYL